MLDASEVVLSARGVRCCHAGGWGCPSVDGCGRVTEGGRGWRSSGPRLEEDEGGVEGAGEGGVDVVVLLYWSHWQVHRASR